MKELRLDSVTCKFPDGMGMEEATRRMNILYLVLINCEENEETGEEIKTWEYCRGTQVAYDYIKSQIKLRHEDGNPVRLDESFIIVCGSKTSAENPLNIYDFVCKMTNENKVVEKEGFDIDDYDVRSYEDDDERNYDAEVEMRYGQGENPVQYTPTNAIDGGEI